MRKWLLLISLITAKSYSVETKYFKIGTELGIGYRNYERDGFDLSFNASSVILANWLSFKGLYLNYPTHHSFYWGLGDGITYEYSLWFGPRMGGGNHRVYPTAEGMIGYEWRSCRFKPFIQLELGVPLSSRAVTPIIPSVTFGIPF